MPHDQRPGRRRDRKQGGRAARATPKPRATPWLALHGDATISAGEARLETRIAYALIAVAALVLLFLALGPHRIGDYFTETDFYGDYAKGARQIQHGRLIPTRYGVVGPVYEIALALAGFLFRDLYLAAKLLSVAATVASLWLWFSLLARRAGTRVALLATLFLVTCGFFVRYGHSATTDALANALQAVTLVLLLAGGGNRRALLAGIACALAFLTRYNAVALLPAGLIAILAGGTAYTPRARAALLYAAGFLAPVVPWVLYSLAHGAGFSFQLHHNIAYEVFAHAKGITWDDYQRTLQPQFHSLAQVIARDPGAVASRMLFNVFDHLRQDARNLLGVPVGFCAALGVIFAAREPDRAAPDTRRALWPVWVTGALLFLTLVPAFYSERYSLALLPIYATLAALPFASERFALALGPQRTPWLKPVIAALPLALALQRSVQGHQRFFSQLPVEALAAADSLRAHARPGDRVMARKPHVATIAGVEPVPFPFVDDFASLAAEARHAGARWLYVSWVEAESRPRFWALLDSAAVVPGLTVRARTRPHPSVLYEIGPGFGAAPAWWTNDTLRTMYTARAQLMVDGTNTRALFALATVERARGRLDRARALLERDAALEPRSLKTLLLLGDVVLTLGDGDAGAAAFDRALALEPANLDARLGRGWAARIAGREAEAARWWRPAIDGCRDAATLGEMIQVFHDLGDRDGESAARAALARLGGTR